MRFLAGNCISHRLNFWHLFFLFSCIIGSIYFVSLYSASARQLSIAPAAHTTATFQNVSLSKHNDDVSSSNQAYPTKVEQTLGEYLPAQSIYRERFTQSQAHMSLPEIKNLINKNYVIKPYQQLIDTILSKEEQYKDTHYVFYHGTDSVWRVPQDLYTKLYIHFNKVNSLSDFIFLRFGKASTTVSVKDFLITQLKTNGLVNDHGEMGSQLLSVNLALFGNVGVPSECTWEYFIKSRGHLNPDYKMYESILNQFGLSHKYIKDLMALTNIYATKEQMIIQVFVPKSRVDDIGYISWIKGIPADEATMEWILNSVRTKRFPKTQPAIVELTAVFKKEQEHNALFKNLLGRVERSDFVLTKFLHEYCNYPERVKHINNVMARLIFSSDVLLNPQSGVKIYRYSTASSEQLNRYYKKLQEIINVMIAS